MNILIINADQLRADCVGYAGARPVRTPNIDALAAESVVYENAFTPLPVCAPARQSLLSGRRPDYIGATWNFDFLPTPELDPAVCWPLLLKENGWNTGYIGHFHVSKTRGPEDFGYTDSVRDSVYMEEVGYKYKDAAYTGGWYGCTSPVPLEDSRTHWQAGKACEMIGKFTSQDKPWHLWVDFAEPHLPNRPSEPFASMYRAEDMEPWDGFGDTFENKPYIHAQQPVSWQTEACTWQDFAPMVARYLGSVSQLDDAIGRIITCLKQSGRYDDTLIFFTSDHGDMCGSHNMLDKHYVLYDDIVKIPLLMKKPGVFPCRIGAFVMNCLDIPATIRKEAGLPEEELRHGRPLPETEAEAASCPEEVLVSSNGQQMGLFTSRAVRTKKYKYVWNLTDIDELYDLESDPGEKVNLMIDPAMTEVLCDLRRRLYTLLTETKDRFVRSEWMKRQLLENRKILRPNAQN